MIKTGELRRNNFIMTPDGIDTVCYINILSVKCHKNLKKMYAEEEIEPVPLTPELLEKCGFKKMDYRWLDGSESKGCFWLGGYFLAIGLYGSNLCRKDMDNLPQYLASAEHLHQLQNLYHSLAGEELKINKEALCPTTATS